MKSTGEVMGVGETFGEAFVKCAARRGRAAAGSAARCSSACANADKPRAIEIGARARTSSASRSSPRAARPRRSRAAGIPVHAGQQGRRRPAAHRRHDQERRDRARRQHGRGKALGDPGQLRDPPRSADRPGADVHDARRRARRCDRAWRTCATSSRTRCRRCTPRFERASLAMRIATHATCANSVCRGRPARASSHGRACRFPLLCMRADHLLSAVPQCTGERRIRHAIDAQYPRRRNAGLHDSRLGRDVRRREECARHARRVLALARGATFRRPW